MFKGGQPDICRANLGAADRLAKGLQVRQVELEPQKEEQQRVHEEFGLS